RASTFCLLVSCWQLVQRYFILFTFTKSVFVDFDEVLLVCRAFVFLDPPHCPHNLLCVGALLVALTGINLHTRPTVRNFPGQEGIS
ncbi:hypothetical protein, partial [Corynebacterium glutamicum]|uniref:hypothetical protein n=1 Tax=Corynebacterium glutamicum TaxID=1718 RepID=UPI001E63E9CC